MLRPALVALMILLTPGCIFSEHDAGCPGKLLTQSVHVHQNLTGPWDIARAWRSFNNTTAWSFAVPGDDVVVGNFSRDPGGVGVMVRATDHGTPERNAVAIMMFEWPRCVEEGEYDAALGKERERHSGEWSTWRERFSEETDLETASPEEWRLQLCCTEDNDFWLGPPLTAAREP